MQIIKNCTEKCVPKENKQYFGSKSHPNISCIAKISILKCCSSMLPVSDRKRFQLVSGFSCQLPFSCDVTGKEPLLARVKAPEADKEEEQEAADAKETSPC